MPVILAIRMYRAEGGNAQSLAMLQIVEFPVKNFWWGTEQ